MCESVPALITYRLNLPARLSRSTVFAAFWLKTGEFLIVLNIERVDFCERCMCACVVFVIWSVAVSFGGKAAVWNVFFFRTWFRRLCDNIVTLEYYNYCEDVNSVSSFSFFVFRTLFQNRFLLPTITYWNSNFETESSNTKFYILKIVR